MVVNWPNANIVSFLNGQSLDNCSIQIWWMNNPSKLSKLKRAYTPHYDYQNFSPLANGTDLDREKYAILQTHWH